MEMNIEHIYDGGVYVTVERSIRVDQLYKIQPTEGFLGIEPGTVRVTHIRDLADLVDIDEDISSQANEFARMLLDTLEGTSEYHSTDRRLRQDPWVVYQYTNLFQDKYVLPLEEFVIHTMQY